MLYFIFSFPLFLLFLENPLSHFSLSITSLLKNLKLFDKNEVLNTTAENQSLELDWWHFVPEALNWRLYLSLWRKYQWHS
jgi:hypothetical protein